MKSTLYLTVLATAALSACAPVTQNNQRFAASAEGVQMVVTATSNLAEVQTTERGSTVGQFRRALLAEIEIAENLLCRDVELLEQAEETVNDTTRATLVYALANCRRI